jgi:hypothetical protein
MHSEIVLFSKQGRRALIPNLLPGDINKFSSISLQILPLFESHPTFIKGRDAQSKNEGII